MQALYEEEKRKNEQKTRRIRQLERIIRDNGLDVPKDTYGAGQGDIGPELEIQTEEVKM